MIGTGQQRHCSDATAQPAAAQAQEKPVPEDDEPCCVLDDRAW